MNITTNNQRRELHTLSELEKTDAGVPEGFEYITGDERHDARVFKYRGSWYDVGEFQYHSQVPAGWDGAYVDSFFSAVVVRVLEGDDDGFVVAGLALS